MTGAANKKEDSGDTPAETATLMKGPAQDGNTRTAAAFAVLWTVVFIDLVGFGILTPLIPFYALRTGLGPEAITLVIAAYSLSQFSAMPLWGHVSDRYGRRPVLLVSMAGHAFSYVLLAYADTWQMLLLSRVLGGITSANLATAYAYVADTCAPAERPRYLGRLSAAFGLGLVVGPVIGGVLSGGTGLADANLAHPAFAAGAFSFLSFIGILFWLPESRRPMAGAAQQKSGGLIVGLSRMGKQTRFMGLVTLCLLVIIFVAAREAILAIWAHDVHGFGPRDIGILLGVSGATITLFQFFAMGPLAGRFGSFNLVRTAILFYMVGWIGLLISDGLIEIALSMMVAAVATALFQTNMQTLIVEDADASERGLAMGVYQGASSMARFLGQAVVGSIYVLASPSAPFAIGAAMMIPALLLLSWVGRTRKHVMSAAE